jgi:hypothetical protein
MDHSHRLCSVVGIAMGDPCACAVSENHSPNSLEDLLWNECALADWEREGGSITTTKVVDLF